jgi:hypothetical protein
MLPEPEARSTPQTKQGLRLIQTKPPAAMARHLKDLKVVACGVLLGEEVG